MSDYKYVSEAGEKSKVVSFRVGEKVYKALEELAEAQGGTISASARNLVLSSLDTSSMKFEPGDTLHGSTDFVVMLVDKETTAAEISTRVSGLLDKSKPTENEAQLES